MQGDVVWSADCLWFFRDSRGNVYALFFTLLAIALLVE